MILMMIIRMTMSGVTGDDDSDNVDCDDHAITMKIVMLLVVIMIMIDS